MNRWMERIGLVVLIALISAWVYWTIDRTATAHRLEGENAALIEEYEEAMQHVGDSWSVALKESNSRAAEWLKKLNEKNAECFALRTELNELKKNTPASEPPRPDVHQAALR